MKQMLHSSDFQSLSNRDRAILICLLGAELANQFWLTPFEAISTYLRVTLHPEMIRLWYSIEKLELKDKAEILASLSTSIFSSLSRQESISFEVNPESSD